MWEQTTRLSSKNQKQVMRDTMKTQNSYESRYQNTGKHPLDNVVSVMKEYYKRKEEPDTVLDQNKWKSRCLG